MRSRPWIVAALLAVACGARTGLEIAAPADATPVTDAGRPADAVQDLGREAPEDVAPGPDAGVDRSPPPDAGKDVVASCPTGLVTLATDTYGQGTGSLAQDDASIYWVANTGTGSVLSVPKCGGAASVLMTGESKPGPVAVDDANVYWVVEDDFSYGLPYRLVDVLEAPKDGGATTTLSSFTGDGGMEPYFAYPGIAIDSTRLYWGTVDGLFTAPLAGGPTRPFVSLPLFLHGHRGGTLEGVPGYLAVDTAVYWTSKSDGKLLASSLDGGVTTVLAYGQNVPFGVAADPDYVYFTESAVPGSVVKVPKAGGTPTTLASAESVPIAIAVDALHVYWTDDTGTIVRIGLDGAGLTTLATGQGVPAGLVVDATSVYWVNTVGANVVMKVSPK